MSKNDMSTRIASENRFDYIEHDVIKLPSKGLFYPKDHEGKPIDSIRVAYLTGEDENILLSPNLRSQNKVLDTLLEKKIIDTRISAKQLINGDRMAILFWLRSTGLSPKYPVTLIDPKTNESFDYEFDLETLDYIYPKDEISSDYTLSATVDDIKFKYRYLNYSEIQELEELRKEQEEKFGKNYVSNATNRELVKQIVELNGNTDRGEIEGTINKMRLGTLRKIKKIMADNEPRVNLDMEVPVPSGGFHTYTFPITARFFFPDL